MSERKRGRPAMPPDEKKRFPLGFRTTKQLREKMEAAARVSGRSLSQEVEMRLERSLWEDDLVARLLMELGR